MLSLKTFFRQLHYHHHPELLTHDRKELLIQCKPNYDPTTYQIWMPQLLVGILMYRWIQTVTFRKKTFSHCIYYTLWIFRSAAWAFYSNHPICFYILELPLQKENSFPTWQTPRLSSFQSPSMGFISTRISLLAQPFGHLWLVSPEVGVLPTHILVYTLKMYTVYQVPFYRTLPGFL